MNVQIALARPADFAAILKLQTRNHLSNLPAAQLAQGFVTTELDEATLDRMHQAKAIWVARADDQIVAYVCAFRWNFYPPNGFLDAARALLPLDFDGRAARFDNTFLYGPICIDELWRGRGLLEELTAAVRARYRREYEFGLGFVDVRNARSLAAHERKAGFRALDLLPWREVTYHVLAFSTM